MAPFQSHWNRKPVFIFSGITLITFSFKNIALFKSEFSHYETTNYSKSYDVHKDFFISFPVKKTNHLTNKIFDNKPKINDYNFNLQYVDGKIS